MARQNSTNNSLSHVVSSTKRTTDDHSPEESVWTLYFEDFLTKTTTQSAFSSSDISPDDSFSVADAASSVANYKLACNSERAAAALCSKDMNCNNLSFKRRKMKELMVEDESLEDTASSPVNSPKVCDSSYFSNSQKQKENPAVIPQGNGFVSGKVNGSGEMGFGGMPNDCTELKKRGLCLVPLSMVVNYLAE